ncbi:hypothetical protein ANN_23519 [Periplaneta americana]|uniref:Uncharacterized protein n=1 Tax=Periplaneta americana TaxID=6978 RepID=A0ABQ8SMS2_PERAM|nr:hypothetical protein ANN_23519 [Periplaneta americana]
MAVKDYLDKRGVRVSIFQNDVPGYEWTKGFLKRYQELSVRTSANIKKVQANIGEAEFNDYMSNLSVVIKDVPQNCIWNYDKTNLSDDPGNKKVICKQGSKYVEKMCNSSKSSTSLMFSGNAEGK